MITLYVIRNKTTNEYLSSRASWVQERFGQKARIFGTKSAVTNFLRCNERKRNSYMPDRGIDISSCEVVELHTVDRMVDIPCDQWMNSASHKREEKSRERAMIACIETQRHGAF